MKTMNTYIRDRLGGVVDELFCDLSLEAGAEDGDITPKQEYKLDELLDNLADLMEEVIEQNIMSAYEVEFRCSYFVKAKSKEAAYAEAKEQLTEDDLFCYIDGKEY